jgi:hypothetical protein
MAELLGGLDIKLVDANNATRNKLAYLTAGSQSNLCVVVPPGAGSTKEETLFWARELAVLGPFFVVMYAQPPHHPPHHPHQSLIFHCMTAV